MKSGDANLSATRGSSAGIAFFHLFLRVFGLRHAGNMAAFIALFYALFDRRARQAAMPYLMRRFPEAGRLRWGVLAWKLMASQGRSLLAATHLGSGGVLPIEKRHFAEAAELFRDREKGFILLTSHFGCWQAAMTGLASHRRKVNLLIQPDRNAGVDKLQALRSNRELFQTISVEGFAGGLFDCLEALGRGEIVCMMGDRALDAQTLETAFWGGPAKFPLTAFSLAARARVPVVAMFVHLSPDSRKLCVEFSDAIAPAGDPERRIRPEELRPALERYVAALEEETRKYPFEFFHFSEF